MKLNETSEIKCDFDIRHIKRLDNDYPRESICIPIESLIADMRCMELSGATGEHYSALISTLMDYMNEMNLVSNVENDLWFDGFNHCGDNKGMHATFSYYPTNDSGNGTGTV